MKFENNPWILTVVILCGFVIGGMLGYMIEEVPFLGQLNYGQGFGTSTPIVLDLGLLVITFGLKINITVCSIIGIVGALLLYKAINK